MFDPHDRNRPTTVERSVRTFYRLSWAGGVLVGLSVLSSLAMEPLSSLIEAPHDRGSMVGNALSVSFSGVLFLLAYLLPIVLMTLGVALPIFALVWFRDFAKVHRQRGREEGSDAFPLRTAWLLVLAEVPALILVGAISMMLLVPADTSSKGLKEREIILMAPVGHAAE